MKWIEVNLASGENLMLNPNAIESVRAADKEDKKNAKGSTAANTAIFITDLQDPYLAKETYEQVKAMLMGEETTKQPDERGVVKQSRWSIDEYGDCTCENCGYEASYDTDYCPGCGAWMNREVADETD